jgi:hypothetical protein
MTVLIKFTNWLILFILIVQPLLSQTVNSTAKCDLPPVQNFTCAYIDPSTILLSWDPPQSDQHILRWDNGYNYTGLGLNEGGSFMAAARWDTGQLVPYQNWYLTHIAFFPTASEASFVMHVWFDEIMMVSQPVFSFNDNMWNVIELNAPVQFSGSQELFIGYEVTHPAGIYPAGCDSGPAVAGYGDIISGGTLSGYGIDHNWNLAGYISPETKDQKAILKHQPDKKAVLLGYDVYLNGVLIATISPDVTNFIDFLPSGNTPEFIIGAVYDECTAMSYPCIPSPYVSIEDVHHPQFIIYPNPTTGLFNIEGVQEKAMVKVFNTFGVSVFESELSLPAQADLSNRPKGIYFIRMETETDFYFKKIVLN